MFNVTIGGETFAAFKANVQAFMSTLVGPDPSELPPLPKTAEAPSEAPKRGRPPKSEIEKKADEIKRAVGSVAAVSAPKPKDEPKPEVAEAPAEEPEAADPDLAEEATEASDASYTRDDVKALLIDVKKKFPKDASAAASLLKPYGATMLKDLDEKHFAAVVKEAREKLAA